MKYKIGDKVVVREDLRRNREYSMESDIDNSNTVTDEMMKLRGKVVTVTDVSENGQYVINNQEGRFSFLWTDEMFEGVKEWNIY